MLTFEYLSASARIYKTLASREVDEVSFWRDRPVAIFFFMV